MNSVGYLVAQCTLVLNNIGQTASRFQILPDGRLYSSNVVDPTALWAKAPIAGYMADQDFSHYFRFGPDNQYNPTTNANGYLENTFSNNSGTLGWVNSQFTTPGQAAQFGYTPNPDISNHRGWLWTVFYTLQNPFPAGTTALPILINDVGSIPEPSTPFHISSNITC